VHLADAWQHVRALFVQQHGPAPAPAASRRPRRAKAPAP